MKIDRAPAAIPDLQSALSMGGGAGSPIRVKLDIYCSPEDMATLYRMQGAELRLTIETVDGAIDSAGMYNPDSVA